MIKIRVELSSLASSHRSGVAQYTQLLSDALEKSGDVTPYGHYFDFLGRQPKPHTSIASKNIFSNKLFPLRLYAKAQSYNIAPFFDAFLPKVDLTIFPNFATWPTIKSRLTATVIHDLTYLYFPEVVEKNNLPHLCRVVPRSIKEADFIITVSNSVKAELVKEFKIEPKRCIVTPIPPNEAFYTERSQENIDEVKVKYGIDQQKKYIYFIGNLEPRKNLKTLVEAYSLLPDELRMEYSLILAGAKGWNTEATQESIDRAVLAGDDVRHIGFVDQQDSPSLYQGASLFVMPSLYEGFGMPILEAMASGCPVVLSDIPVMREVGGKFAKYASPLSPESFSSAIIESLQVARPKRSELQKNTLRYSWADNIKVILETVHSLK